uniref:Protein white n=1 Tax=Rhizophora mucronata TaxID=61149 RepID=A0A2P2ILJ9_RHIMU
MSVIIVNIILHFFHSSHRLSTAGYQICLHCLAGTSASGPASASGTRTLIGTKHSIFLPILSSWLLALKKLREI